MPTLTVRQLDDELYQNLKSQAESHGRSMESEVRDILAEAVRGRKWGTQWIKSTEDLRGEEVPTPSRSAPRPVDLS